MTAGTLVAILGQDPSPLHPVFFSPIRPMEERDRRGGERWSYRREGSDRRYERPNEPRNPPSNWRAPAVPPPRRYDSRGRSRERTRRPPPSPDRYHSRKRNSRTPTRPIPPRRSERRDRSGEEQPSVEVSLGRTSGVAAAGAWAARFEMASLLESRCDPGDLVRLIKSGKEGPHVLSMVPEVRQSNRGSSLPKSWIKVEDKDDSQRDLFSDFEDWEKEVERQQAILDSLADKKDLPPWASKQSEVSKSSGARRETEHLFGVGTISGEGKTDTPFLKKAAPPPASATPVLVKAISKAMESGKPVSERSEKEPAPFLKPANPPPPGDTSRHVRSAKRRKRGEAPVTMAEVEAEALSKYNKDCTYIYDKFKRLNFEMDLVSMVEPGGVLDKDRFRLLTRPNRASTGLNYSRLIDRYLRWRRERTDLDEKKGPLDLRMGILDYVEYMMQKQVGYLTPRSFLYAVDYFSSAFGFEHKGKFWNRAKRLALMFANSKSGPVVRAPCFLRATLVALEMAVQDPYLPKPVRVACGKLRLCVQASTRYDDILNTPLSECEWIRKPGEDKVLGLRSRATRGKTGPRLWVASLKGACRTQDGWLQTLMTLLLESHGATWKSDDHMGKLATSGGEEFTQMPARLETDVNLVKSALERYAKEGIDTGLKEEEIAVLRWHGAKATLSSIMQHLNLPKRVVRWQGNWSSQGETMPDTYLRESQILILGSQEKCLEYLRQGGDFVRLVGEQLAPDKVQEQKQEDESRRERAMASDLGDGASLDTLPKDFLDNAFSAEGLLSEEVLKKEKDLMTGQEPMPDLLKEEAYDADSEASSSSESIEKKPPGDDKASGSLKDPVEAMDEADTEKLTMVWVQAKTPGKAPKVHLPYPGTFGGDKPPVAVPKCGTSGDFELIKAEETLDAATKLCKRCSPSTEKSEGCEAICSHLFLGRNVSVYRCIRRCKMAKGDHSEHRCSFHTPGPKAGGAK